jgi:asparagine synthase (glutamine-hydrolysing)
VSVQFGRWSFDGQAGDREYLSKAEEMVAPYGPDGGDTYIKDSVAILFRALHTTKESRVEAQPHITPSGMVLTWDGRLDNRAELFRELRGIPAAASTDVSVVAAAYEQWGTDCFARLLGDWALSVWNPRDQSLILAKDPIGTRHLYYSLDKNHSSWSTILDPLVLLAGKNFKLDEEYIAGWLSFFPGTHLSPYVGIHSVPPCTCVLIRAEKHTVSKYWDFDPSARIRYCTDAEYEEHFRVVFAEAIRRRLRSDSPVLAELSGGMDSSSIVCMADAILTGWKGATPRLDTVSYYNDSEPNWNERPYFTKVEEQRGRLGCHIDTASQQMFNFASKNYPFEAAPACTTGRSNGRTQKFVSLIQSKGNRVVLSGIGGDEVMGGVPTAIPQLQDLLTTFRYRELARQLKVWALNTRRPWFHLLMEAIRGFLPLSIAGVSKFRQPATWLNPGFVAGNRPALIGYQGRLQFFGPPPAFQANLSALESLRRQLTCQGGPSEPPHVKCYPYLDRSLLEFAYAIPREQLVRPGQRRSLMRRALAGIVPHEIFERKRKAFVARRPRAAISTEWASLCALSQHMTSSSLGIVDRESFLQSLHEARNDKNVPLVLLMRTIFLEVWLRNLLEHGILSEARNGTDVRDCLETTAISAEQT